MFQTLQPAFAYLVSITNEFNNNNDPLVMHCWSHDDDLGVHTLWKNGEWHWEFGNKFLGRTHFLCNMKHGNKEKTVDVYDSSKQELECDINNQYCIWSSAYSQVSKHKLINCAALSRSVFLFSG
ncbi:hypothetical protein Q3G72_003143 [Acer saccharum]|nr:hypothetical protein Q3G72_003143 [Acer saccharum]